VNKPLVYIACPYTKGNQALNVRASIEQYMRMLIDDVVIPINPLFSHFAEMLYPKPYEFWLKHDFDLIRKCDALLRINATYAPIGYQQCESDGCNREIQLCQDIDIPVFYYKEELYRWAIKFRNQ